MAGENKMNHRVLKSRMILALLLGCLTVFGSCGATGKEQEQAVQKQTAAGQAQTTVPGQAQTTVLGQGQTTVPGRGKAAQEENQEGWKQGIAESLQETEETGKQGKEEAQGEDPSITLVMVGDILLHTPVAESGLLEDGSYNFDALFENVAPVVKEADLALVNQEVILGGKELGVTGYPRFNAPFELGDALVNAGFDVVLHATNHALDKGKKGLVNCQDFWKNNYPETVVLGIHDSPEDQEEIFVYEQNGIRVAVLNYTYGTNGIALPQDMTFGVDLLEESRVEADLAKAEELADFTVVCPHWGTEYNLGISKDQKRWTDIFLEGGADLVIGTHPHVIEPVEWVAGEDGRAMLVYYSLGNFVNWTSGTGERVADRMVGGMARVELEKNAGGEVYIADYSVEPLVCHLEKGNNGVSVYFLEDYTAQLAQKNEIRRQDPAFSLEYCIGLCEEVWE